MQDPYGALNAAKSIGQLASKTATSSFGSTFINALPTPLAFAGVNQVLNYLMTVGEKKRAQMISNIVKEEQMRNQIILAGEQMAFDKDNFDKNSIPIGSNGKEIHLDGERMALFYGDDYNVFDLSTRSFKPLHYEEALNNSKVIAVVLANMREMSESVFLSDDKKQTLRRAIDQYVDALLQCGENINFITSLLRTFSSDYTFEELEQIYQDYKEGKNQKPEDWKDNIGYYLGSRNRDKKRYIAISVAFDALKEALASSFDEIKTNLNRLKGLCIKKLTSMNVFKEKRKSELLTRVSKSKTLLQRLYVAYKNNGHDLDNALSHVACELYRKNELIQDRSFVPNEQNKKIRSIEKKNTAYTSDDEVKEQVKRYFNFDPNVTRFIKTEKCDIKIDKYSKIIEIQDRYNGAYYLDFNQFKDDVCHNGGVLYYKMLLSALQNKADDYAYTAANPKYVKVMQYIEDVVAKIESNSLTADEYEYMPNMLFHWISSLTNKSILQTDEKKKIVTVTFMDGNDKSKLSDEIDDFYNVSFDIYDQETKQMKMGTIIRKGEKIYYKEDPGLAEFRAVSAEELLKKLNVESLKGKDIETEYIGDTWQMRKMIDFVQKMRDKELKEKKGAGKKTKQAIANITENRMEPLFKMADVKNGNDFTKQDIDVKDMSNIVPINKLGIQSGMHDYAENDKNNFQFRDVNGQQNFDGNKKSEISYKKPSMNLHNEQQSVNVS